MPSIHVSYSPFVNYDKLEVIIVLKQQFTFKPVVIQFRVTSSNTAANPIVDRHLKSLLCNIKQQKRFDNISKHRGDSSRELKCDAKSK